MVGTRKFSVIPNSVDVSPPLRVAGRHGSVVIHFGDGSDCRTIAIGTAQAFALAADLLEAALGAIEPSGQADAPNRAPYLVSDA